MHLLPQALPLELKIVEGPAGTIKLPFRKLNPILCEQLGESAKGFGCHQHDLWPISHLRVAKETAPARGKLGPKVQGGMPHIGTTLI